MINTTKQYFIDLPYRTTTSSNASSFQLSIDENYRITSFLKPTGSQKGIIRFSYRSMEKCKLPYHDLVRAGGQVQDDDPIRRLGVRVGGRRGRVVELLDGQDDWKRLGRG